MRVTITILSFIFILCAFSGLAQEAEIPSSTENIAIHGLPESNLSDDKPLLVDHDFKLLKRDSVQTKVLPNQKGKGDQKSSSSKNDDALSFNFLYYIIQKFKISDLVDN